MGEVAGQGKASSSFVYGIQRIRVERACFPEFMFVQIDILWLGF